jgi:beta-N-acetylhexosaminidase
MIGIDGTTLTASDTELMQTVKPGGIILFSKNIQTATQTRALISAIQAAAASYSPYPLFIAVDEEGGVVSRIPWITEKIGESAIENTSTAYLVAQSRAKQLRELGITVNLAPVLDFATATDFLYNRTFQKSYDVDGALAAAMVEGARSAGIASTLKHFPGYVGIPGNPELKLASVAVPEIRQFQIAANAAPTFIMVANVLYPTLDPRFAFPVSPTDVQYLKSNVPGNYLIMSDDLSDPVMRATYGISNDVVMAMNAGVDIELVAGWEPNDIMSAYNALVAAVDDGTISRQTIDAEYAKVLAAQKSLVR